MFFSKSTVPRRFAQSTSLYSLSLSLSTIMGFITNTLLLLASSGLIAPVLAQDTYDYIVVGSGET